MSYVFGCVMACQMGYARTNAMAFSLWQLPGQTRTQMNSYVIRTAGNELIVIDGGNTGDATYLSGFIRDQGNHVHAWFISHPHSDHVDALTEILNNPEGIRIDAIYASLPDEDWMKANDDGALDTFQKLNDAVEKSNHKILELSIGQKIVFQGAIFEILAIRNPELTANAVNNQSVVWRVDGGGKSVLFLGDLGVEGGKKLLASGYRSRLKADYVQMAHHGQNGVNEEFYKTVNPQYLLWPTPDWLWDNNRGGKGRNSGPWKTLEVRAWMEKLNIKRHYIAKDGLHRIDF